MDVKVFLFLVVLFVFLLLNKGNNFNFNTSYEEVTTKAEMESYEDDQEQTEDVFEGTITPTNEMTIVAQGDGVYYSFIDKKTKKKVIEGKKYSDADHFFEGLAMVGIFNRDKKYHNETRTYGYIDINGNEAIPLKFADAGRFGNGLAPVKYTKRGKYGYINKKGELVIDTAYLNMAEFHSGRALVSDNVNYYFMPHNSSYSKIGFIDTTGKMVIPQIYDYAYPFSEGLAAAKKKRNYGFIDPTGNEVIPFKYSFAAPFVDGMAPVKKEGKLGFIDKNEKTIIPFDYTDYKFIFDSSTPHNSYFKKDKKYVTREGYMILSKEKWGYLSYPSMEVKIPFIYDDIEPMNNQTGEIFAQKDGFWGVIDINNKVIVPFDYQDLDEEFNGMRSFKKEGLWGFMNSKGKEVIPPRFKYKSKFYSDKAYVQENGSYIYINKQGKTIN